MTNISRKDRKTDRKTKTDRKKESHAYEIFLGLLQDTKSVNKSVTTAD